MASVPVQIVPDYDAMSAEAARIVADAVQANPALVLALPTGGTPLGMFKSLIAKVEAGTVDFARTQFFCLDEYAGVTPDDPNSLTGWLFRSFMDPARVPRENIHMVPSSAPDPEAAAKKYESELASLGGLELAVLGLGPNGHIAFNEPGSAADSRTRLLDLTQESIDQSAAEPGSLKAMCPFGPNPSTASSSPPRTASSDS